MELYIYQNLLNFALKIIYFIACRLLNIMLFNAIKCYEVDCSFFYNKRAMTSGFVGQKINLSLESYFSWQVVQRKHRDSIVLVSFHLPI